MVSFARVRTRSWISKLWPLTVEKKINNETFALDSSNELMNKQQSEKEIFLETIKNGGIWFS